MAKDVLCEINLFSGSWLRELMRLENQSNEEMIETGKNIAEHSNFSLSSYRNELIFRAVGL